MDTTCKQVTQTQVRDGPWTQVWPQSSRQAACAQQSGKPQAETRRGSGSGARQGQEEGRGEEDTSAAVSLEAVLDTEGYATDGYAAR